MSDTPETDAVLFRFSGSRLLKELENLSCKLERERDEYKEKCRIALSERDSWRFRAEQKYAMRRELEELLGVNHNDASDDQMKKGLNALKNIIAERDKYWGYIIMIDEITKNAGMKGDSK